MVTRTGSFAFSLCENYGSARCSSITLFHFTVLANCALKERESPTA